MCVDPAEYICEYNISPEMYLMSKYYVVVH